MGPGAKGRPAAVSDDARRYSGDGRDDLAVIIDLDRVEAEAHGDPENGDEALVPL